MGKYTILWRPEAIQDVDSHLVFLSKVSKEAAFQLNNFLLDAANSLIDFPERNPVFEMTEGFQTNVRKMVVNKRYLLIYVIEGETVEIYRVLDTRKQFEHLL